MPRPGIIRPSLTTLSTLCSAARAHLNLASTIRRPVSVPSAASCAPGRRTVSVSVFTNARAAKKQLPRRTQPRYLTRTATAMGNDKNDITPAPPGPSAADGGAIFSSNTDPEEAALRLKQLLIGDHSWALSSHRRGIERSFQFKTFKNCWGFMDAVAAECKVQKHHPEWANVYNRTHVRWTTHKPEGLSYKDLAMAEFCDAKARDFGEQDAPPPARELSSTGDVARDLSERIADDGCDVCAPRSKP